MADLSKIKLNGTIYYLKDAEARDRLPIIIDLDWYYDETDGEGYYKTEESFTDIANLINNGHLVLLRDSSGHIWFFDFLERGVPYFISISQMSGILQICPESLNYNETAEGYLWKTELVDIHQEETMANVTAMLQEFGLDTTTILEPGIADTAHADSLVLTQ